MASNIITYFIILINIIQECFVFAYYGGRSAIILSMANNSADKWKYSSEVNNNSRYILGYEVLRGFTALSLSLPNRFLQITFLSNIAGNLNTRVPDR